MTPEQYQMVCVRRQAFDSFVWQVPPLAIAAQAFLLAASLNDQTPKVAAAVLALFSALLGLASIQLVARHRQCEIEDSERLRQFEADNSDKGYAVLHGKRAPVEGVPRNWLVSLSSFRIWTVMLAGFFLLAVYAISVAVGR